MYMEKQREKYERYNRKFSFSRVLCVAHKALESM